MERFHPNIDKSPEFIDLNIGKSPQEVIRGSDWWVKNRGYTSNHWYEKNENGVDVLCIDVYSDGRIFIKCRYKIK